jgi:hypothetical protein
MRGSFCIHLYRYPVPLYGYMHGGLLSTSVQLFSHFMKNTYSDFKYVKLPPHPPSRHKYFFNLKYRFLPAGSK